MVFLESCSGLCWFGLFDGGFVLPPLVNAETNRLVLNVCAYNNPPFSNWSQENKPEGFFVEIRETLAKNTDVLYEYKKDNFDASSDAIITLKDGHIKECNAAALRLFGCADRDYFSGKSLDDLSPERQPDGTLSSQRVIELASEASKGTELHFEWQHKWMSCTSLFHRFSCCDG